MKRGTNVTYENDESGRGYYAVTKKRGRLTIDEVEDALRERADHDYYALIAKVFDEDSSQYFFSIDIMGLWKEG